MNAILGVMLRASGRTRTSASPVGACKPSTLHDRAQDPTRTDTTIAGHQHLKLARLPNSATSASHQRESNARPVLYESTALPN